MKILVSACLLGVACKYSGGDNACPAVLALAGRHTLIPVCPEQLGGLATPRDPAEICGDRVVSRAGRDVTQAYQKGAEAALYIAKQVGASAAVLKANSPSCGKGVIYDGSFTGRKIAGSGIAAQLLSAAGIPVFTEDEIPALLDFLGN